MLFTLLIICIVSLVIFMPLNIENSFEQNATDLFLEVGITEKFELPETGVLANYTSALYFNNVEKLEYSVEILNPEERINTYYYEINEYLTPCFEETVNVKIEGIIVEVKWVASNGVDDYYVTMLNYQYTEENCWIIKIEKNPAH